MTIFMQLKCLFSIIVIFNCCHFATDHPHTVKKCSLSIVITLHLTVYMQLKCSFSIFIMLNCCHFATDCPHAVKTVVVSLFVQMTKFKSYLSSYQPMQKASNWKSGLDMEGWLTPWSTSTHKRPFIQEGNYLVVLCPTSWCNVMITQGKTASRIIYPITMNIF